MGETAVLLSLADFAFNEPRLLQVDLVGELQAAAVGDRPHRATRLPARKRPC